MPKVKHVVLLRFRQDATPTDVARTFQAVVELQRQIPGLLDVSCGNNSSPEGLGKGFTHGFVMTFRDEASRDGYLPHPAHEAVKQQLLALIDGGADGVIVIDWVEAD